MRVIKREIKGRAYYYLQHSVRKNGKVVTREKYLGTAIPGNVEEIKVSLRKNLRGDIFKKLEAIRKQFWSEWSRLPKSVQEKNMEEFSISFTYNTNAIEGSTITFEEAREIIHDKIAPNKPLRDVKETEAHSRVFLKMLDSKEKLAKKILLGWHKEIFFDTKPDIAGKLRDYLVRVGDYVAPDWQDVEKMMGKLIVFSNEDKLNAVELAARAHYRFEKIHPFGDGNGRIGRLLLNRILWHNQYPMLVIEYKKRKSYYRALQKDEESFVNYFLRQYSAVHKRRLR